MREKTTGEEREQHCRGGDDCDSDAHFCKITKREDMQMIRQLVRDAQFFCRKCGHAAREEANPAGLRGSDRTIA